MARPLHYVGIGIATIGVMCLLQVEPAAGQGKRGVIPHAPLLTTDKCDTQIISDQPS